MYKPFFPTRNIIERVFCVSVGSGTATAFTVDTKGSQYLVTAKHFVKHLDIEKENNISLFHEKKWKQIKCHTFYLEDEYSDIAILKLEKSISSRFKIQIGEKGESFLGQDMMFLGFPYFYNISYTNEDTLNNYYPIPLIKKACSSSIPNENGLFYLDGHNNPGFSGAPVLFQDLQSGELKLYGILSGYIPQNNLTKEGRIYQENSGIIVAYNIKQLDKIIEIFSLPPII